MAHQGLLNPVETFTPVRDGSGKVIELTVHCVMYSIPFDPTGTAHYIDDDGVAQTINSGCTDEDNQVHLGSISFTWPVPTAHQSTADPYKINWKWLADRTQEKQLPLIKASTDYKNMMTNLTELQIHHGH